MADAPATEVQEDDPPQQASGVEVQEAQLPDVEQTGPTGGAVGKIDILLDTAVSITAILGEAEMTVRDVLQLGPGSVVKLRRRPGEALDLYMRGIRFATGSLVVVGDQLGIKINEILAPDDQEEAPSN